MPSCVAPWAKIKTPKTKHNTFKTGIVAQHMQKSIKKISFAGAGNVAWHLANGLKSSGFDIRRVWSRDIANAGELAESCGAEACPELSMLREQTDLIIIATADNAIAEIAAGIGSFEGVLVHTAGSVPMEILADYADNFGVLYPLQTFSKGVPADLGAVPFFTEASSEAVLHTLNQVARSISAKVHTIDSRQRLMLHTAAVFAGNYSNLMYIISNELLANSNLPADALHPLILETSRKAVSGDAKAMQTGPARRNDTSTLQKHLSALASIPEYAELYKLLASMITKKFNQ